MKLFYPLSCIAAMALAGPAMGALVTTQVDTNADGATVDGTLGTDEYGIGNSYAYTGGGGGFGGTHGSGTLYAESDGTNLYIGLDIQGDLGSNIIGVFLDTRSGGFSDDTGMDDAADGGRALASNLTRDVQDNFDLAADFVLEFGNGFTNLFELQSTGNSHIFSAPGAAGTGGNGAAGFREASISLAALGLSAGDSLDFFSVLISDTGFASNEGLPNPNIANNPGFDNADNGGGAVTWSDRHRFTIIPEPASLALVGLGGLAMISRRRA